MNNSKVVSSIKEAIQLAGLKDGMTISFHHHLRNGDYVLNMVMDAVADLGIKDLNVNASSVFDTHEPLIGHIKNHVVTGLEADYIGGVVGRAISHGVLDKPVTFRSHGGRPSDIEQAIELGLDVVKFFPAEQSGGLAKIKAMAAPYVNMKFMPTGGVNAKNLTSYLDFPKIIACGGSWMVPGDLINAGEWDKIEQLTREAVQTMLGFELAHVGVNAENEEEAVKAANRFAFIFGMPAKVGNSSVFAGSALEVMKTPYLGKNGHIAVKTNYIERAVNYLSTVLGVEFNEESAKRDAKGNLKAIYLKEEIGGFAVHLVQK